MRRRPTYELRRPSKEYRRDSIDSQSYPGSEADTTPGLASTMRQCKVRVDSDFEKLEEKGPLKQMETLYRHNVLLTRAALFNGYFLCKRSEDIDLYTLEAINEKLQKYCEYREVSLYQPVSP